MKLKNNFKACIAGGAALFLTACNDQTDQSSKSAPVQTSFIHVKSSYDIPHTNTSIKEYTSDSSPGKIFTIVAGGMGVAITSNPVPGNLELHDNSIHIQSRADVPGWNTSVVEFTSDNVPDTVFSIAMGGTSVALTETPIVPKP